MNQERNQFLSRLLWKSSYFPVLIFALAIMFARLLVAARLLAVNEFASYSAGLLVSSSFCMLGGLGLQILLQREMPLLICRGKSRQGIVLLMQALAVAVVCASVGMIAAWLGLGLILNNTGLITPTVACTGLIHGLSQQSFLLVTIESRSRLRPLLFACQYMLRSILIIAVGFIAMRWSGSSTVVIIAEALITITISTFILRQAAKRAGIRLILSTRLAISQLHLINWRTTIVLLAVMASSWLAQNLDRWIAERTLIVSEFALYAFAANAITVASALQMTLNSSIFPKLAHIYESYNKRQAFRVTAMHSLYTAGLGVLIAPVAWLAWELLVPIFFPAYIPSVKIAPIIIAVCLFRVSNYWSGYLLIVGKQNHLLLITIFALTASSLIWYFGFMHNSLQSIDYSKIVWFACITEGCIYIGTMYAAWRESVT